MKNTVQYYAQLIKFRLSTTVVFSAVIGYLLGVDNFSLLELTLLILGGFLVTGSANAFNQILEKEYDSLMKRTANRPLPQKNLSISNSLIFAVQIGIIGLEFLFVINPQCSFFGLLSILLYVFAYTPLKRISPISIFVGAIPGAIPFLLGWVAATNDFGMVAGLLFAIQFFWQFPHFIAIAWVQDKEYKKAGFKMMFGAKKGKYAALISVLTSVLMLVVSVIPYFWKITELQLSVYGAALIFLLGTWFTFKSIKLYNKCDDTTARNVMLASFAYLPLMQIIYILDKILIQ
ncbi:MAG: protoheme IX farnesyltransferase [Flavobacteriales bacterium]|nr:protoheme IX farnesyltransferase [Flavobacteriales bacterium]